MRGSSEIFPTPVLPPRIPSALTHWAAISWLAYSMARAFPGAPCCAKSAATLLCAILHFDPALHFDRSEFKYPGPRRHGADALLGKLDARVRGFFHAVGKSLEAGAPRSTRDCSHVFSARSALAGGRPVIRRVCIVLAFT